jgi:ATP-dependent RNA helicase DDX42
MYGGNKRRRVGGDGSDDELERWADADDGEAAPAADGEEDELDAFMRSVQAEAALPAPSSGRPVATDPEEEPGAGFGEAFRPACGYDSDADVYATAAALEAAEKRAEAAPGRGDALPLAAVSHEQYEPFEKDFYTPVPEIARLDSAESARRCAALGLRLAGRAPPAPVERFGQCSLPPACLLLLKQRGYTAPTPVQAAALPAALSGRDVLACAATGSGKTVAYLLPALVHAAAQRALSPGEGPIALVLAPTRELGQQVHTEAVRLAAPFGIAATALLGGHDKSSQVREILRGCHLAVATPGRAIDLARGKLLPLSRVTFLVLDEADRLLDLGFEAAVRSLAAAARPDAQALLFSATLPQRVAALADSLLEDAVRLHAGGDAPPPEVTQRVELLSVDGEAARITWLLGRVSEFVDAGEVIVFVARHATCDAVAGALRGAGVRAAALHGDMDQAARSAALADFRAGRVHVLVATDVVARGLDVPGLRSVVNLEPARDMETHTHRVGRTGRAGALGCVAVSLLGPGDAVAARMLVAQLEAAYAPVSQDLYALAARGARSRKGGQAGRGRGRGLGFAVEGRARPAAALRGSGFVPSSEGKLAQQTVPEIVAPKAGWKAPAVPPPRLPPPPPVPPAPPVMVADPASAARAAAAAIAARLLAHAAPPPPSVRLAPTESYNAMPPPSSLGNTSVRPVAPLALTPAQAAARALAEAAAARMLGRG